MFNAIDALQAGIDKLVEGATLGHAWINPMSVMASAIGAHGASVTRLIPDGRLLAIANPSVAEPYAAFVKTSTLSTRQLILREPRNGFVTDSEPRFIEQRKRDPFYQDYVRKIGLAWRMAAHLDGHDDYSTRITFWRDERQGPFETPQIQLLNAHYPTIRAAAAFTRVQLEWGATTAAAPFEVRSEAVYYLSQTGRVLRQNAIAQSDDGDWITYRKGRIETVDPAQQAIVDSVIRSATSHDPKPKMEMLCKGQKTGLVLAMPVTGNARDLWGVTAAIVVLINRHRLKQNSVEQGLIKHSFGLTNREAEISGLTAVGYPAPAIASMLGIQENTARLHLKSALSKMDIHRQTDLVRIYNNWRHLISGNV